MSKVLLVFVLFLSSTSFSKEVALTIDDAPRDNEQIYTGPDRTKHLIEILKKEKVQTAFFCNSVRLGVANGRERIQAYAEAGHIIANHTHSHASLSKMTVEHYLAEIDEADKALKEFPSFKRWFRFPYLKEGKTITIRDQIRRHLKEAGYMNAYVTVDNYDYVINDFVQRGFAKKLKVDLNNACEMLSELSLYGLEEQEKMAKKYLGRDVTQVLLMHENDLEVFCLDRSIKKLRDAGWDIVSPEKAYSGGILSNDPDTLWLDQGRIAAMVAQKTGQQHKSKWESMTALNAELNRRKIVIGLKAE